MSVEFELAEALVVKTTKTGRVDEATLTRLQEDIVPGFMRGMIPRRARINVPLRNGLLLRETGNILAGLGQRLMALSHSKDMDEEHQLQRAVYLVREAQHKILYFSGGASVQQKSMRKEAELYADSLKK